MKLLVAFLFKLCIHIRNIHLNVRNKVDDDLKFRINVKARSKVTEAQFLLEIYFVLLIMLLDAK